MLGSYKIRTDLAVEARERFTEENVEVRGVEVREEYNEEKEIQNNGCKDYHRKWRPFHGKASGHLHHDRVRRTFCRRTKDYHREVSGGAVQASAPD